MTRVLVVEDEPNIAFALEVDLQTEGYQTTVAGTGPDALAAAARETFDLILLDVMLPGKDGFDVCRELRRSGVRTPIILLTAKTHDAEKVMGLDLGADDYVTKPFNPHELRARIRAVLRRGAGATDQTEAFRFGNATVDFGRAEVTRDGTGRGSDGDRVQAAGHIHPRPRPPVQPRPVARRRVGRRRLAERPRRRQPHRLASPEDRARAGRAEVSHEHPRPGLPI